MDEDCKDYNYATVDVEYYFICVSRHLISLTLND